MANSKCHQNSPIFDSDKSFEIIVQISGVLNGLFLLYSLNNFVLALLTLEVRGVLPGRSVFPTRGGATR